jgi:hypothetical protein
MRVPTFQVRWFGFSLLLIAGTVGCTQSGTGVPTMATPSSAAVPSAVAVGPSANYSATGTWCFVEADEQPFQRLVTQDGNGDLHFLDEDHLPVTLERLSQGAGAMITYRLAQISGPEGGGECDIRVMGTVLLDTTTNTLTANVRLKELGCSNGRLGVVVTATKSSCPL